MSSIVVKRPPIRIWSYILIRFLIYNIFPFVYLWLNIVESTNIDDDSYLYVPVSYDPLVLTYTKIYSTSSFQKTHPQRTCHWTFVTDVDPLTTRFVNPFVNGSRTVLRTDLASGKVLVLQIRDLFSRKKGFKFETSVTTLCLRRYHDIVGKTRTI